jgi:DNA-binding CsgD family transcriptional regulator
MNITKMKNKGGRPQIVLTDKQITEIEELAQGMTIEQIADYFGIGEKTFYELKNRDHAVLTAYKKGKAKGISGAISMLRDRMREGDTTAIIFYLKTQAGWSTSENKNYVKSKFNFSKDKSPLEIIDSILIALDNGEITIQEANQLANLAHLKASIKANTPIEDTDDNEPESREELMAKVYAIQKVIDYEEKINEN